MENFAGVDGGLAEGKEFADPGVRNPISANRMSYKLFNYVVGF